MSFRILVYDDSLEAARVWVDKIELASPDAEVMPADKTQFKELMGVLSDRRSTWRSNANNLV